MNKAAGAGNEIESEQVMGEVFLKMLTKSLEDFLGLPHQRGWECRGSVELSHMAKGDSTGLIWYEDDVSLHDMLLQVHWRHELTSSVTAPKIVIGSSPYVGVDQFYHDAYMR